MMITKHTSVICDYFTIVPLSLLHTHTHKDIKMNEAAAEEFP